MNKQSIRPFVSASHRLSRRQGQSIVEYALILAFIAVIVVSVMIALNGTSGPMVKTTITPLPNAVTNTSPETAIATPIEPSTNGAPIEASPDTNAAPAVAVPGPDTNSPATNATAPAATNT